MTEDLKQAIETLNSGGIIIFPTDTAFGIGCRIDNEKAIQRLFTLRRRPETKATPVLVSGLDMAKQYLKPIPEEIKTKLIQPHWPGALTIVLPCLTDKVPDLVRGGSENLGVRMPDHPDILEIIHQVGVPILAPSANFHGEKTPYTYEDLDPELVNQVDFVLKGNTKNKSASTVIDCSMDPWKILREGGVKINISL